MAPRQVMSSINNTRPLIALEDSRLFHSYLFTLWTQLIKLCSCEKREQKVSC